MQQANFVVYDASVIIIKLYFH